MNNEIKEKRKVFIPTREVAELTGLHPHTIRSFADKGVFEYYRTPTGQRKYNKESILKFISSSIVDEKEPEIQKQNYLYARVSSRKQSDDLERQIEFLRNNKQEYIDYILVKDIGSGINFKRKGLQTILDSALQGTIGTVVIAHKDRLARFGFELIEYVIKSNGGDIIVIDDQKNKSSEQELAEDLLSIIHIFSCREMGKRKYKQRE